MTWIKLFGTATARASALDRAPNCCRHIREHPSDLAIDSDHDGQCASQLALFGSLLYGASEGA